MLGFLSRWFGDDTPEEKPAAQAPPPLLAKPKAEPPAKAQASTANPFMRSPANPVGSTWNANAPGVNMTVPAPKPATPAAPAPAPQRDLSHIWNTIPSPTAPTASPDTKTAAETTQQVNAPSTVLELLNSQGWTTPTPTQPVRTPDKLLMPGEQALADYQYQISDKEWQLIQDTYSTPEAKAAGFAAPSSTPTTAGVPLIKAEEFTAAPMTWDQYESLSADQRAAVDFNTLLVEAREKDVSRSSYLTPEEQKTYDENVRKIFGEGGGSVHTSPAVVDLLTKVDFQAVGQDLDEYLSLERAITADELKDFKITPGEIQALEEKVNPAAASVTGARPDMVPGFQMGPTNMVVPEPKGQPGVSSNYADIRSATNLANVDSTAIAKTRTMIENAMRDPNNALWSFETAMSGTPATGFTAGEIPLGYGTGQTRLDNDQLTVDTWLQSAYNYLSDPTTTSADAVWAEINDGSIPTADKQQFLDYVDARTQREAQYGAAPNDIVANPRSPALVRDLVGLK